MAVTHEGKAVGGTGLKPPAARLKEQAHANTLHLRWFNPKFRLRFVDLLDSRAYEHPKFFALIAAEILEGKERYLQLRFPHRRS